MKSDFFPLRSLDLIALFVSPINRRERTLCLSPLNLYVHKWNLAYSSLCLHSGAAAVDVINSAKAGGPEETHRAPIHLRA